jgi:hypothetical protein
MPRIVIWVLFCSPLPTLVARADEPMPRKTEVSIAGEQFFINGKPTYEGRTWKGHKIEGLLFNSRMVQGVFDDANPSTAKRWVYPDTGKWDPDRNTREFVAAMPDWRRHGLLAFTLCLQGGSPYGYFGGKHPWNNAGYGEDGKLQPAYVARAEKILDAADELGMVVILSCYYFGQDERLRDEQAVKKGVDETVDWILRRGYRNVVIEINNECDNDRYDHEILKPERVHELIQRAKDRRHDGRRLLVGTSYCGGRVPTKNVVRDSDFLLIHGNGQSAKGIKRLVKSVREVDGYRPMPIVNNEDDHYEFDEEENNFTASIEKYCSWGYFDFRKGNDPYENGYQSVPVDWRISSPRKQAFFKLLAEITGADGPN